jgi:hydrogenase assembly chaperone HypC/HupF
MCSIGIPGQVLEVGERAPNVANVRLSSARRAVDISPLANEILAPGDCVLVHAGLALSKVSDREAQEPLALPEEMSEVFAGQEDAPSAAATGKASELGCPPAGLRDRLCSCFAGGSCPGSACDASALAVASSVGALPASGIGRSSSCRRVASALR